MILETKHINTIAEAWEVKTSDLEFYINENESDYQFIQKYGYHPKYSQSAFANEVIIVIKGTNLEKVYKGSGAKIAVFELR